MKIYNGQIRLLFIAICFLLCLNIIPMVPGKDSDLFSMKRITSFHDIASCADRIVMYKTDDEQFGSKTGYQLLVGSVKYGYVAQKPIQELDVSLLNSQNTISDPGYRLSQLIDYAADSKYKSLRNSKIKNTLIFMRLANRQELDRIHAAIQDNKARFEYIISDCNPPCGWTCLHLNPDKERMYGLIKQSQEKLPQEIPSLYSKSMQTVKQLLLSKKMSEEELKKLLADLLDSLSKL